MSLEVGDKAPDFELSDQHGQTVRLSDLRRDGPVVLVFFPRAFTPTCTGELCAIRDREPPAAPHSNVVAISCDSSAALRAYAEAEGLDYPLLSDFWPHGEVSRAYGVFLEDRGFANRGTFIVDSEGFVRWKVVTSPKEARDPGDYEAALAAL